jgi:hypothetical protein
LDFGDEILGSVVDGVGEASGFEEIVFMLGGSTDRDGADFLSNVNGCETDSSTLEKAKDGIRTVAEKHLSDYLDTYTIEPMDEVFYL